MSKPIKTIQIKCEAAGKIGLDELTELQGNLKILTEERYQKLRASILELGFSFPVNAWKNGGKNFILDATQRTRTLKRMRDEDGYTIPGLPVVWVKANDKKEAVKKLLAAASQYGEITPDGLYELITHFGIDFTEMNAEFSFPELDMSQFQSSYYPQKNQVAFEAKSGSKELDESDFQEFDHQCPKCGFSWGKKGG